MAFSPPPPNSPARPAPSPKSAGWSVRTRPCARDRACAPSAASRCSPARWRPLPRPTSATTPTSRSRAGRQATTAGPSWARSPQGELGEPDASGRRRPVPIEGSTFTVPADAVVLALGYWPDPLLGKATPGLETPKHGLIVADYGTGRTSLPGVFAAGDAVSGPDLGVNAMRGGPRSAAAIDEYLRSSL